METADRPKVSHPRYTAPALLEAMGFDEMKHRIAGFTIVFDDPTSAPYVQLRVFISDEMHGALVQQLQKYDFVERDWPY